MAYLEMRKPVILGFKVEDGKFRIFQITAWKVRMDYHVEVIDGKPVCSCPLFKYDGKCSHSKALKDATYIVRENGVWEETEAVNWMASEPCTRTVVIRDDGEVGIIQSDLGSVYP